MVPVPTMDPGGPAVIPPVIVRNPLTCDEPSTVRAVLLGKPSIFSAAAASMLRESIEIPAIDWVTLPVGMNTLKFVEPELFGTTPPLHFVGSFHEPAPPSHVALMTSARAAVAIDATATDTSRALCPLRDPRDPMWYSKVLPGRDRQSLSCRRP